MKTVTEMSINELIKEIWEMMGKIPYTWCEDTKQVYELTWSMIRLHRGGYVTIKKSARLRIEDFYWVVERKFTQNQRLTNETHNTTTVVS